MLQDSLEINPPQFYQPQTSIEINNLKKNLKKSSNSLTTDDLVVINKLQKTSSSFYKKPQRYFRSTTPDKGKTFASFSRSSKNFFKNNLHTYHNLITDTSDDLTNPITLRNNFQMILGRLNVNSTKEIAFKQLKDLIYKNATQDALRVYISALSTYSQNSTINAMEFIVLIYGYIASVYKENLMDPLDKPPNIVKTINRILTHIRNFYLKENSFVVHKACSHSFMNIYDHCMPKDNLKGINLLFIEPLLNLIVSGKSKFIQEGAAVCLSDFIYHLGKEKESEINMKLLTTLDTKIMSLFNKHSIDIPYVYEALFNLMQFLPFETFTNYLKEIYDRTITILCKANANKFNTQSKINCLNLLGLIALKCKGVADITIGYYQSDIIKIIEYNTRDKIHKIQMAANDALKNWKELTVIYNDLEKRKGLMDQGELKKTKEEYLNSVVAVANKKDFQNDENDYNNQQQMGNYIKKMDKFNFLRNLAKMAKLENKKVDYDTELPEQMKEDVYKKGIGNVLKLSNFMKFKSDNKNNVNKNDLYGNKNNPKKYISTNKNEINSFLNNSEQVKKFNNNNNNIKQYFVKDDLSEVNEVNEMSNYNNNSNQLQFKEEIIGPGTQFGNSNFNINNYNYNNNGEIREQYLNQKQNIQNEPENIYPKDFPEQNQVPFTSSRLHNNVSTNRTTPQKTKNHKTYINSKNIVSENYNNQYDMNEIKNTLSSLINDTLIETYNSFEQNINSRLYDMEKRIKDIYLQLEDLYSHPNYLQKSLVKNKVTNSQRFSVATEVGNDYNFDNFNYQNKNTNASKEQITETVINEIKNELSKKKHYCNDNFNADSAIIIKWKEALSAIEQNNFNKGYELILNAGDDIYLLRLICITGPVFANLTPEISKKILLRINMISRSHQIQSLLIKLIKSALEYNIFNSLNVNEQNDILDSLFEFSGLNTSLGREAAELYTKITK